MKTNQPIEEKKIMKIKEPALYKGIGVALSKKGRKVINKKVEDYMKTKPKKVEYFTFLEDREFKESEWMKEQSNYATSVNCTLHQCKHCGAVFSNRELDEAYKRGQEDEAIECYKDLERTMKQYKASLIRQIGLLRQWLNEDRITEPKKMITNKDIKDWLF